MPIHLDVLGRLHVLLGGFAVLAGVSLLILAGGTSAAAVYLPEALQASRVGTAILAWTGGVFVVGGITLAIVGRALAKRRPASRFWALCLAVPNLVVVPFGTALGVYTFWVLLNDDARRAYGRPVRAHHPA